MQYELNWFERLQFELYKEYLKMPKKVIHDNFYNHTVAEEYKYHDPEEAFSLARGAAFQFIGSLGDEAKEEMEEDGWEKENFEATRNANRERHMNEKRGDLMQAYLRQLSQSTY